MEIFRDLGLGTILGGMEIFRDLGLGTILRWGGGFRVWSIRVYCVGFLRFWRILQSLFRF